MLSTMHPHDRSVDSRGGRMIGLAALVAMLAPLYAGAQQQTQQTQQQQQQQQQRPVVPLNQHPAVNTPAPANQTNGLQKVNPGLNLLNKLGNQNAGPQNTGPQNLLNKLGNQNAGPQNTGPQNLLNKLGNQNAGNQNAGSQNNAVHNIFNSRGNQNPNVQQANAGRNLPTPGQVRSVPHVPSVTSPHFPGHPAPPGSIVTTKANGDIVRKARDGSVIDVRSPKNGMLIHHAPNGIRRVVVDRPDHSRIVVASRGLQYVQHPYKFGGHTYVNRTFYVHGQLAHQLYRPYNYAGTDLDVYATSRYYAPNFYQWATSTQSTPQPFAWGYTSNPPPWFAYYRGYFTPDSSYTTPTLWLTDFLFASSLASHYQNYSPAASDAPAADGSAAITPDVKQAVAAEISLQVKQESTEAQQAAQHQEPDAGAGSVVNEISDRQQHTFVADADLDLVDQSGNRCMISEGDVVQTSGGPQSDSGTATAVVLASKGGTECARATQVEIALTDLQEMQNHMRETIDQGMAKTNAAQKVSSTTPEFAAQVPPPDPDAPHELEQGQQMADVADG